MTITRQTALNEILIRLADDGSVAGAHVVEIEHLTDTATGEILSSRLLPTRGITAAEVGGIIGSANAGILEQIDRLRADLTAMTADRDAEKSAKDQALSGKSTAEAQRDAEAAAKAAALEQVATLTADLAAERTAKQDALTGKAEAEARAQTLDAQRASEAAAKDAAQAEVSRLTSLLADVSAARDAALAERAEALSAAAQSEAQASALSAEKTALLAQIEALNAQLHPVDAVGFPILSAVQVRLALLGAGITFSQVDAAIENLPQGVDRDTARTYWEYAFQFERGHPFIAKFAAALGLSDEQVDAMWRSAAQIR